MKTIQGDFWSDDFERPAGKYEPAVARVIQTEGGRPIGGEVPFPTEVLEAAIRDRDEQYGVHVHAFNPMPPKRHYWLITWPVELDYKKAAEELLVFTLGMLPDEGWVLMPDGFETEQDLCEILDQPIVFSKRLEASGQMVDDEVRSIGDRFVVVTP